MESLAKRDPLLRIKYIGYCLSHGNLEENQNLDFSEFVRWAKFQICSQRNLLMEDPIWERYTDEQILIEYYAILYSKDKESRLEFEAIVKGEEEGVFDWMQAEIDKNQEAIEAWKQSQAKLSSGKADPELEDVGDYSEDPDGFEFSPKSKE